MSTPDDDPIATVPARSPAVPVKKREIFGWAMYDFANSSYTTVVISVVYSAFFTAHIVPENSPIKDTYWSAAIIASTLIALLLSPFVGAVCDYSGGKKKYLGIATATCALSTAALFIVGPGDVWWAIALLAVSNAAFMIGESFCGSFLTDLATKKNMGIISGLGWGLGYFGGLSSLVLVMFTIGATPEEDYGLYVSQNQWAMILIGVFYAAAALPTFLLVRERSVPAPGFERAGFGKLMGAGLKELRDSFALARSYRTLFGFFLAFTIYMAGLEIVIKFVGIYAQQEIELTSGELVIVFIILQISAALGALAFGLLEARIGAKPTVLATIAWWIGGVLAIFLLPSIAALTGSTPAAVFFVIALIAGAGLGSIQSSSRTVVGLLAPPERSAQMFGFWGTFSRLSIILGTLTFGPLSDAFGRRHAILAVLGFFIVGGVVLFFVPIGKHSGERATGGAEAA
ncbi:MAG: MFS transporter [Deltaproteobacteria bacterium]|nr:MFS transporter [Deltaproteobacteria bacterium]